MRLSVAIAGAMVMLAFLSACEFKSPADRVNEAVDELIEDSVEDVFGTPTPQSGGVPAPPARNAPTEASSGAAEPKIEPTGDSGPTATPQSMAKDAEGRPEAGGDGTTTSFASVSAGGDHTCRVETGGPSSAGALMRPLSPRVKSLHRLQARRPPTVWRIRSPAPWSGSTKPRRPPGTSLLSARGHYTPAG